MIDEMDEGALKCANIALGWVSAIEEKGDTDFPLRTWHRQLRLAPTLMLVVCPGWDAAGMKFLAKTPSLDS